MRDLTSQPVPAYDISRSIGRIDTANSDDPTLLDGVPLALVQGRLAHTWVGRLDPSAGSAMLLASRAHHLRRWIVARSSYPQGRAGYLSWRRDQKTRHGEELTVILVADDTPMAIVRRAVDIVRKIGLGADDDVQTFEDAVALTFIETQLLSTADKLGDDDKMVAVVRKTLLKMSPAGIAAAATIDLSDRATEIIGRAGRPLDR